MAHFEITINKEYDTFKNFHDENIEKIYKKIIRIFEKIITEKCEEDHSLTVTAECQGTKFSTLFNFKESDFKEIKSPLMNYFELVENYEFCHKIKKIEENFYSI